MAAPEPVRNDGGHAWRSAVIAGLTILALFLPLAVHLLVSGDGGAPGPAAPSAPATAPSAGRSTPPSGRPSTVPTEIPDGRIPMTTLADATLTIPPWPADNVQGPSGRLRFRAGVVPIEQPADPASQAPHRPPTGIELVILSATYGDIDRDGADETVAQIACMIESGSEQLIAFDRDRAGHIVTMGTVVATTGEIRDIATGSARVTDGGAVTARLADYQRCCDDRTPQVWQRRGHRWSRGRFEQVSGPLRMPVNPYVTEVGVVTGELVLGPVLDGYRYGTLAVTVRHVRGVRPARVLLEFFPSPGLERAGTGWPPLITGPRIAWMRLDLAPPPAEGSVTHTFAFRRPAALGQGTLDVAVGAVDRSAAPISDTMGWDNGATARIRTVD